MASETIINIESSDDEDIPGPSGLKTSVKRKTGGEKRSATSSASYHQSAHTSTSSSSSSIVSPPPKKKVKAMPSTVYSLIWVCTHGKGKQRRSWRKKDLKIVGVYPSKNAAEEAKQDVMSRYDCCGHGDILVGGTWEDEIDLVIREAPMHF